MLKRKILVVEDNPLNMKLVRTLLNLGRFESIEANTAKKGIELAKVEKPDLIIMDIQLPDMDGLTATRIIKQDPVVRDIPIVAITAYAMQGDEKRTLDAGCSGYITKPIETKSFLDKISGFMSQDDTGKVENKSPALNHSHTVLIADDDPLDVKILHSNLLQEDYKVILAYSGQEALEKVDQEKPDIILLDIMMPGIDGYEVTRRLKASSKTEDIPIILITSLTGADDKAKGMEAGADEFLNKPVNTTELLSRVKSLIRSKAYQEKLNSMNKSETSFLLESQASTLIRSKDDMPAVLLVEDNETDCRLFRAHLNGQPYQINSVKTGEEALAFCEKEKVDLLILDLLLPGMDGFDVCRQLKDNEATRNIQILMVTSLNDLESKNKGIELGADDYLIKPIHKDELSVRVRALLRKKAYRDLLNKKKKTPIYEAIADRLTDLYNRDYFYHFINFEIKRCDRQNKALGLIMLDIDNFKDINDSYGQHKGDRILKEFGYIVKNHIREIDLAARYSRDTFFLVLPCVNNVQAEKIAERVREAVTTYDFLKEPDGGTIKLSISMGIALYPEAAKTVSDLIDNASRALDFAKKHNNHHIRKYS